MARLAVALSWWLHIFCLQLLGTANTDSSSFAATLHWTQCSFFAVACRAEEPCCSWPSLARPGTRPIHAGKTSEPKPKPKIYGPDIFRWGRVSGPQKGPAERGHVKKCQKVSKIFSTLFGIIRAGQKTSKIVKKCQKYFGHFSTIFARHRFSGPFWGPLVWVYHAKGWGPKSSVCPSQPGKSNFLGGIMGSAEEGVKQILTRYSPDSI